MCYMCHMSRTHFFVKVGDVPASPIYSSCYSVESSANMWSQLSDSHFVFQPLLPHTGMGRLCTLSEPVSLSAIIERIKGHLRLPHVRVAVGAGRTLGKWTCQPHCLLGLALQEHREQECVHDSGKHCCP